MDVHIFCKGDLIPRGKGRMPSGKVFDRKKMLVCTTGKEGLDEYSNHD